MSNTHDIDNEETFFQFDPYDEQQPMHVAAFTLEQRKSLAVPNMLHTHDGSLTSEELAIANEDPPHVIAKGKERTMPMPIRSSTIVHDFFDASPPSVTSTSSLGALESSSSTMTFSPSLSTFLSFDLDNSFHSLPIDDVDGLQSSEYENLSLPHSPSPGKGKEKETYPFLPPLSFSAMELNYDHDILSAPGPSSYSTVYSPSPTCASLTAVAEGNLRETSILSPSHTPLPEPHLQHVSTHQITRSQSLSNLSQPHSLLGSVSTTNNQQPAFGPARTPSNLSRQLTLDKQDNNHNSLLLDVITQVSERSLLTKSDLLTFEREPGSYPPAWYTVSKPFRDQVGVELKPNAFTALSKVRSKSSPCPLSALDFIPSNSTDIFQPLPIIVLNYFDLVLAKELRLRILRALVELHEEDLLRSIREGRLTMAKATSSKGRWVGRDKGIRELFKLSRVCPLSPNIL